ncbi:MAG: hypothetical protein QGG64_17090, partial [Candidatus Latescibacteria bacterium]|nr:hypothetical protein [Candidatus Latescibacterota bacterium]
ISGLGDDGWSIVDVRQVSGTRIVLSPKVGVTIDLEEGNRYALFQGTTVYTQKIDLSVLRLGVSGFQSAEFMKRENGKPAIKIRYRSGPRIESRLVNMKNDNDLRRLREYIENFDAIVKGDYTLADSSQIAAGDAYPQYTDDLISFEERRPRFPVRTRLPGTVTLTDGKKIKGEFVPVFEDGRILIETDLSVQKVAINEIQKVAFHGERGSLAMEKAIMQGLGGAATGAIAGAFAGWQANADVKETMIWAAAIFGIFGFITGLVTGAKATQSGETFELGPVEGDKRRR